MAALKLSRPVSRAARLGEGKARGRVISTRILPSRAHSLSPPPQAPPHHGSAPAAGEPRACTFLACSLPPQTAPGAGAPGARVLRAARRHPPQLVQGARRVIQNHRQPAVCRAELPLLSGSRKRRSRLCHHLRTRAAGQGRGPRRCLLTSHAAGRLGSGAPKPSQPPKHALKSTTLPVRALMPEPPRRRAGIQRDQPYEPRPRLPCSLPRAGPPPSAGTGRPARAEWAGTLWHATAAAAPARPPT